MKQHLSILFLTTIFLLAGKNLQAQCTNPAKLDVSFGVDGSLVTYSDKYSDYIATTKAPDGSIVSVGLVDDGTKTSVFVSKINANGTFVSGFGAAGIGVIEFAPFVYSSKTYAPAATDVVVLPNGTIAISGYATEGSTLNRQCMLMLLDGATGSRTGMPSNIGIDGISFYKVAGSDIQSGRALTVDGNGKIVLVADFTVGSSSKPVLWKIDPSNSGGSSVTSLYAYSGFGSFSVQDIEADNFGYVTVAMNLTKTSGVVRGFIAVVRVSDGVVGSYFEVAAHTGSTDFTTLRKIKVLSNGLILATGSTYNGSATDAYVCKFYQNGAPDLSFGTSGKKYIYTSSLVDIGLVIETLNSESTIIVAGSTGNNALTSSLFVTKLSNTDGALDMTFSGSSATFVVPIATFNGYNIAATLSADSRLIAAGSVGISSNERARHVKVMLKCVPSMSFASPSININYGAQVTNTATSSSTATIIYSAGSSGASNVLINPSSGQLTTLHAGSASLVASQQETNTFYAASVSCPVTIQKASLTVTANAVNKLYGATNPAFSVSYFGFVNTDGPASIDVAPTVSTSVTTATPVGFYTVIPSGGSDNDYTFSSYTNGQFSVIKAPLTVTVDNKTKMQGDPNPAFTYTISGFANGENSSVVSGAPVLQCSATTGSLEGSYPITLLIGTLAATNYNFPDLVPGQLVIGSANSPNLVQNNLVKTYGDANFNLSATSNSTGAITYTLLAGSGGTVSNSGLVNIISGGTLSIKIDQAAASPYSAATTYATVTIRKKTLLAVADDQRRLESMGNPTLTATYTGFVNSDTQAGLDAEPIIYTVANSGSAPGAYNLGISGGSDSKYEYIYQNGTLTVEPLATPSLIVEDASKLYGDADFSIGALSNSPGAITYTLLTGSTGVNLTSGGNVSITGIGFASIQVDQAASGNFAAATAYSSVTIDKKDLTISVDNKIKAISEANPSFTYTITGFVNGENESQVSGSPEINCEAGSPTAEGSYSLILILNTLSADNYYFKNIRYGTLLVQTTTDMKKTAAGVEEVSLYPVPSVGGLFHIASEEKIESVSLTNAAGQEAHYAGTDEIRTEMSGLVHVRIVTQKGVYRKTTVIE